MAIKFHQTKQTREKDAAFSAGLRPFPNRFALVSVDDEGELVDLTAVTDARSSVAYDLRGRWVQIQVRDASLTLLRGEIPDFGGGLVYADTERDDYYVEDFRVERDSEAGALNSKLGAVANTGETGALLIAWFDIDSEDS